MLSVYVIPLLFFVMPLVAAFVVAYAFSKVASRRVGRSALSNLSALVFVVSSNAIYLAANATLGTSPLGSPHSWGDLWFFGFAPITVAGAMIVGRMVDRLHEDEPYETR